TNTCNTIANTAGGGGGDCSVGDQQLLGTGDSGFGGCGSPIIVDVEGEGFHLTSAANGVTFDISGTNHPIQIAWTATGFRNAFLELPEADGMVRSGKDLFGNFTAQDKSKRPNGFLALAEWDEPDQGGNGDGVIDDHDAVWPRLRLWIDENHDGISQPNELHPLQELGVFAISVNYFRSPREDEFGNKFRYRGRVNPGYHRDDRDQRQHDDIRESGRWAYDVFFVTAASTTR